MIRNLVLLFSFVFVPLTALDTGTTYVGVRHQGYVEVNVFTNTSTLWTMVWPEILIFVFGVCSVFVGTLWGQARLRAACDKDFATFMSVFERARQLPSSMLIFIPTVVAFGRIFPVTSNILYITLGWSPYGSMLNAVSHTAGCSVQRTNLVLTCILMGVIAVPVTYVIYRTCRLSAGNITRNAEQTSAGDVATRAAPEK
jgi:uncharacterized membrane protein